MQHRKKHSKDESESSDGHKMLVHDTDFFRQVEGVGLDIDSWVGRDAWFGNFFSCVELKLYLNANRTFIVKIILIFPQ